MPAEHAEQLFYKCIFATNLHVGRFTVFLRCRVSFAEELFEPCLGVFCQAGHHNLDTSLYFPTVFFFFHFTTAERDYMLLNKQRLSNRFFFFNFQDAALSRLLLIFHVPLH